jgi:hypothetical protein
MLVAVYFVWVVVVLESGVEACCGVTKKEISELSYGWLGSLYPLNLYA